MENSYRQLQRKLNTIGVGMPESSKGVDETYLKVLFDEEEVEFALKMDRGLHTAAEQAESMGIPVEEATRILEKMAKDGLVYYAASQEGDRQYYLVSTYHGFFEWNVGRMDPSWVRPMVKHNIGGLSNVFFTSTDPMFRYLPIRPDLVEDGKCLDCDNMEKYIRGATKCAVTPCFCRCTADMYSGTKFCKQNPPEGNEICLAFNDFASFYVDVLNVGRYITHEEALEIMSHASENGTACMILNDLNCEGMCSCCGCCCGVIGGLRAFGPGYAKGHVSNYYSVCDADACVNCGTCVRRCITKARHFVKLPDGTKTKQVEFDIDRCMGCGVCVDTCEKKAIKLVRKPDEDLYYAKAKDYTALLDIIAENRRKTNII